MKGSAGFEEFYGLEFGERWPILKAAMLKDKNYVLVPNPFAQDVILPGKKISWFTGATETSEKIEISTDINNLKVFYPMDGASLLPIIALELKPNDKVLDLCAAPGGKSLMMFLKVLGEIDLTSNDRSPDRVVRIKKIINEYIPENKKQNWKTTKYNAEEWGLHEQDIYDKVLVDVPCSSERHVLMDKKELANWNIKRPKRLAIEQFGILCSALSAAKPGARIVYSTCALSKLENDDVIEKLHTKREGKFKIINLDFPIGEKTKFGWRVLPDATNHGPFYLSIIEKI